METLMYDVVVTGGGACGISAAITAAKLGARTLLIDAGTLPGGSAIQGITAYRGRSFSHMMNGFVPSILKAWGYNVYDPQALLKLFCSELTASNICVMTGTTVFRVKTKGNFISSLRAMQGSTIYRIKGKAFLDCTGGHLFAMAGLTVKENPSVAQTLLIGDCNPRTLPSDLFEDYTPPEVYATFPNLQKIFFTPTVCGRRFHISVISSNGLSAGSILELWEFLRRKVSGFSDAALINLPGSQTIWEDMHFDGYLPLTTSLDNTSDYDVASVCRDERGDVYCVKFGSLLCSEYYNLARGVGIINLPTALSMGEALGAAAALVPESSDLSTVNLTRWKAALAPFDLPDVMRPQPVAAIIRPKITTEQDESS